MKPNALGTLEVWCHHPHGAMLAGEGIRRVDDAYQPNNQSEALMSIPVPMEELRAAIAQRGASAYVLTVSADARPHVVHAAVRWQGDTLAADVGKRSAVNAEARSSVSLLYPVRVEGDYSLIIDGTAVVASRADGHLLLITPTKAVLHRPAAAPDPASSCGADCVPFLPR